MGDLQGTEVPESGKPVIRLKAPSRIAAPELPKDIVREGLVDDMAAALYSQRATEPAAWAKLEESERATLREDASQLLRTLEINGWVAYPENRTFNVVIDDPDMSKRYEYEIEAPTAQAAVFAGARQAIFEDPTGGMPSIKTKDALLYENTGLIDAVSMYGVVTESS